MVACWHNDTAGATTVRYYETGEDELVERDVVQMDGPMEAELLGFVAREYDVHVPI